MEILKKELYGFKPTTLDSASKVKKSMGIGRFWDFAKRNQPDALPCLKNMLEREKSDGFFCYDASTLLFSLDNSKSYRQTIIAGLQKCETAQIEAGAFLSLIVKLSMEETDVTSIAKKFLQEVTGEIFFPRSDAVIDGPLAGMLIFGTVDDELATKRLISLLRGSKSSHLTHSAAITLFAIHTDAGSRFLDTLTKAHVLTDTTVNQIESFSQNFTQPYSKNTKYTREDVLERLSWLPFNIDKGYYGISNDLPFMNAAYSVLTKKDVPAIRKARQKAIAAASEKSLNEYIEMTRLLFEVMKKK